MAIAPAFGDGGDLGGKPHRHDHQGFAPIAADHQQIGTAKPGVEFAKSVAAAFHFDATIDPEQRHR
jgi:hypothetical protein